MSFWGFGSFCWGGFMAGFKGFFFTAGSSTIAVGSSTVLGSSFSLGGSCVWIYSGCTCYGGFMSGSGCDKGKSDILPGIKSSD